MAPLLGIAIIGAADITTDLAGSNQIADNSFLTRPFTKDSFGVILRCISGLGPPSTESNIVLGGWYFNGVQLPVSLGCIDPVFEVRAANRRNYPGMVNLYLCGTFTTTEEGVYSCIMMNSSMMEQTMRVGLYLNGRSESLNQCQILGLTDNYLIICAQLLHVFCMYLHCFYLFFELV